MTDTALDLEERDEELEEPAAAAERFYCEYVGPDGEVCGRDFASRAALNGHIASHKRKGAAAIDDDAPPADAPPARAPRARGKRAPRAKKPKAPAPAADTAIDRPAAYAAGISLVSIALYTAVPAFDEYDLSVLNAGTPNLAAALAELGNRHPALRQALDLAFVGGSGPYLALVVAGLSIAMPIAAHHGAVPASTGERFAMIAGVDIPPTPAPAPAEPDDTGAVERPPAAPSFDPPAPSAAFDERVMGQDRPTVIGAPADGVAGSEQPAPPDLELIAT